MQSQDIIKRSATNGMTPPPQARDFKEEVAKLIDVSTCIGCKACQVACSEWNDIRGAIIQYANGIVDFQSEHCIGCGYCIAGCPFNVPRLNPKDNRVYKCTLCVDRVSVGQEPACVKTCPTGAIHFGTKKEMLELASERVEKLKKRGYAQAGIYDPAGVGGTHVIYVLHHNDQPELYHGLPKDPQIDTPISLWKGILKPLSAAGFIATFAGLIFHYVGVGPNKEVDDDEEEEHHD